LAKVERKKLQIVNGGKVSEGAKLVKIGDKLSNCRDLCRRPLVEWGEDRVNGYFVWAYAVCKNLRGVNEHLDTEMNRLFSDVKVDKLSEADTMDRL
jgi:guanosine-3',5'-bis(diphosphate) 3'-pyrophosphohydrolase